MPASVNYRLVAPLAICIVIICGCQKGNDEELAKAKAEAEAAKAQLEKLKADAEQEKARQEAELRNQKTAIHGELYATTKGGDVKRGAGVHVRLIPLALAYQADLWRIHKKFEHVYNEQRKAVKNWTEENPDPGLANFPAYKEWTRARDEVKAEFYPALEEIEDEANAALAAPGIGALADSDGRFSIQVEPGDYLLMSGTFSTQFDKIIWFKVIKAIGPEMNLSLNQESAALGFNSGVAGVGVLEPTLRELLGNIVVQLPK